MLRTSNNILLKKDDVGLSKPSTRELPQFGHSYGLPGSRDPEGVGKRKNLKKTFLPIKSNHHFFIFQ